nr:MAG TPA: Bacterial DNA-binding protein [Caudoviricetes sp.]
MVLKKKEIADELALRTGFFKGSMKDVVDALDDIIVEKLGEATFDEDVEIQIAKGLTICARRVESREARDPRNQKVINIPEKVIPYAKFTYTFRQKINE